MFVFSLFVDGTPFMIVRFIRFHLGLFMCYFNESRLTCDFSPLVLPLNKSTSAIILESSLGGCNLLLFVLYFGYSGKF